MKGYSFPYKLLFSTRSGRVSVLLFVIVAVMHPAAACMVVQVCMHIQTYSAIHPLEYNSMTWLDFDQISTHTK